MILISLIACGGGASAPQAHDDHDHAKSDAHGHEDAHGHDHEADAHGHDDHPAKVPLDAEQIEVAMGVHKARLVPGGDAVELQVLGEDGAPVAAEGEAKMVLTGTEQEAQRIVLKADGASWKGAAKLEGAKGYLAVVSVPVGGATQSARFVWGDVPEAAPAPEPHDHPDGGHAHGEDGHDHGGHGHEH